MNSRCPKCGVVLHDVPEDRTVADLDHRLGTHGGLLGDPAAEPAREQHDLHDPCAIAGPCTQAKLAASSLTRVDPTKGAAIHHESS